MALASLSDPDSRPDPASVLPSLADSDQHALLRAEADTICRDTFNGLSWARQREAIMQLAIRWMLRAQDTAV